MGWLLIGSGMEFQITGASKAMEDFLMLVLHGCKNRVFESCSRVEWQWICCTVLNNLAIGVGICDGVILDTVL